MIEESDDEQAGTMSTETLSEMKMRNKNGVPEVERNEEAYDEQHKSGKKIMEFL